MTDHAFMGCQPGSCALPHPMPNPEESGCHWPYGNVFFGGSRPYHTGDPICMLTEAQHAPHEVRRLREQVRIAVETLNHIARCGCEACGPAPRDLVSARTLADDALTRMDAVE